MLDTKKVKVGDNWINEENLSPEEWLKIHEGDIISSKTVLLLGEVLGEGLLSKMMIPCYKIRNLRTNRIETINKDDAKLLGRV